MTKDEMQKLYHHLERRGIWEIAKQHKNDEIRRLRKAGMKRPAAQAAAWRWLKGSYFPFGYPEED